MAQRANGKQVDFDDALPTRADYDAASPRGKGYLSYTFAEWPGSKIPKTCPFKVGTREHQQWCDGQNAAVLDAQDSEE